jgi:hypothetical protein
MRKTLVAMALLAASVFWAHDAAATRPGPAGDAVRTWNDLALATARATNASDAQAARLYAMVNVAIYDAVNALAQGPDRRMSALVAPVNNANGDPVAAAAGAAHDVLVGLYPDRASTFDAQLESDLAGVGDGAQARHGRDWGGEVAAAVLEARTNDGSSPTEVQPPGSGPGKFASSWSGTQFRNLKPFVIADPDAYVSAGPPALDSLDYAAAYNEVKIVGNAANPDAGKLDTFRYWSLGANTDQPPGAWVQVGEGVSQSQHLSLGDTARLLALETMAMADTVAPTYKTKFVYDSWRPTAAIRQVGVDDGNPNTVADPTWAARAGSAGSSPEHWSGHSSFSASAAEILKGFFCSDHIAFSLVTDSAPNGQGRTYQSFSAAAAEAGRSRVVGGFHFEFSNQAGLSAGRAVANDVLTHALLAHRGPMHHGECPL